MIVYQNYKGTFLEDILTNNIEHIIHDAVRKNLNKSVSESELRSWKNSLRYMSSVLQDALIPESCNIAIEYRIPQTSKRIDFIITGQNENKIDHAVIIELKQWESAGLTEKDAVVQTYLGKSIQEVSHPSYQAWSYAALLNGFNETVYSQNIQLKPCAYLHNYIPDGIIDNAFYADYIVKAPLFLKSDAIKLRDFIKSFLKFGDTTSIMYRIESGKLKPSKALADSLSKMMKGKQEFVLIDDQKVIFETALSLARKSSDKEKTVFIIEGGPGTGKTIVAINLLVALTKLGLLAQYVTKNAAPRAVYETKLTGTMKKSHISAMFKGSGNFHNCEMNSFDALIVDEAHRLNEKSGLYGNLGENQVKEIVNSSKCAIFFVDEDQHVTLKDIGTKMEIRKWAAFCGAKVYESTLTSQFRCNGSDGYLSWLTNTLNIRETANETLGLDEYEFKIFSSPVDLREALIRKNFINNKARLVAGYCWDWNSKKNPNDFDIIIEEFGFEMRWNLSAYGSLWLIDANSINEIGCIHTCQGLELDYVGVIIGPDLIVRNGVVVTDITKRSIGDHSIRGYKNLFTKDKKNASQRLDLIIKNTYRTLMTRGLKGCYIYCTDKETEAYFKSRISSAGNYSGNDFLSLAAEP